MKQLWFAAPLLLSAAIITPASAAAPQTISSPPRFFTVRIAPSSGALQRSHRRALSPAFAATFTTIDVPGAGNASGQGTVAYAINSSGVIAGDFSDSAGNAYAFIRAPDGTFTAFGLYGGQTLAYGINDKGAVSGTYLDPNTNNWRGYKRTPTGKFQTFDPSNDNGNGIFDPGINNGSTVVGDYTGTDGDYHSFFRSNNGTLTEFDAPGATGTLAWGINKVGTISGSYDDLNGTHGYVRATGGTFTEFDAPGAGGFGTIADKLNNKGWVSGDYTDSSNVFHAYLRDPAGKFTEYDAPDAGNGYKQGTGGEGGINRNETVAAAYFDSSNVAHGYMRLKNGSLTEFDPPGSTWTETWDLNDSDVVVGDYIDSSGVYHGFIRTP